MEYSSFTNDQVPGQAGADANAQMMALARLLRQSGAPATQSGAPGAPIDWAALSKNIAGAAKKMGMFGGMAGAGAADSAGGMGGMLGGGGGMSGMV